MPISNTNISYIHPLAIVVGARQRSETNTGDLKLSIEKYGILNPILVAAAADEIHLVAGRRRLACAIELNLPQVPIRFYDTADPNELKVIELEENIKREELPWRDRVRAIGEFHELKKSADTSWTVEKTAACISFAQSHTSYILTVYRNLDNPAIEAAGTLTHAFGILERIAERRTAAIVDELLRAPTAASASQLAINPALRNPVPSFINPAGTDSEPESEPAAIGSVGRDPPSFNGPQSTAPIPATPIILPDPILVGDFLTWAPAYSGPKFNLIHCDFPYGVNAADFSIEHYENTKKLFATLTDCLIANFDRIASYSAHVVFWLSFSRYEETKTKLRSAGLHVLDRPLIWVKSSGGGNAREGQEQVPRYSYEIALLAHRGGRPLVKQAADSYVAPAVANPLHPTQKPEPMLKHFLSMLVDNVTDMIDPTAGSGAAIRAAEELGVRSTLGIELSADYARAANAATLRARESRKGISL